MDPKFQTTFIPKKPISGTFEIKRRESVSFFLGASLILGLVTISMGAGSYFWEKNINDSITSLDTKIQEARRLLDEGSFVMFQKLNDRVRAGKAILSSRRLYSEFLDYLERSALSNVALNSASIKNDGTEYSVSLKGQAMNLSTVALQSDEFSKHPAIKSAVFSGLELEKTRRALFSVSLKVNPSVIKADLIKPIPTDESDDFELESGESVSENSSEFPANPPPPEGDDLDDLRF